jgi:hypothetical protein
MTTASRLAVFAAAVAVLTGGAAAAGKTLQPDAPGGRATSEHGGTMDASMLVRGLSVDQNGLRLVVDDPAFRRNQPQDLRFRILDDARGEPVRDFDLEHTKRMHLIVVRRDLTGFQHLHPRMQPDGTWTMPLRLTQAGSYRVFADFSHDDQPTTLASDLRVDGSADLRALPVPETVAQSDRGDTVHLDATPTAGEEAGLRFTVTRHGAPVELQPYLGADGHLIALRDGDLAFLHVHPTAADQPNEIHLETTFTTPGRYRLFLQFREAGRLHTAAFTLRVQP